MSHGSHVPPHSRECSCSHVIQSVSQRAEEEGKKEEEEEEEEEGGDE